MALKVGELYGLLKLDKSQFDKGLKDSGTGFGKFKGLIVAGAATAGLAILAIGGASAKMAIDFQKNMANVNTLIGPGTESAERIKVLGQDVKDMSLETGKSLDDLSGGLYEIIGTFGDTAESAGWLKVAAKASSAGLATTQESVSLLAAVTKSYGDTSLEAAQKASDLAFQTMNLGVTTFPEMAQAMGRVIPMAAAMKISQEELFAAMATLTGVTGSTDEVVTQLRGGMTAFLKPSGEMKDALKELGYTGVNAGQDLVSEHGIVKAIQMVAGSATAGDEGIQKLFRNTNTLNAVLALTGESADDFAMKLAAMEEASGATDAAFKIQQETVAATMDRVGAAFNVVLVNLGEKFLPMLQTVLDWVLAHMPEITAIVDGTFAAIGAAIDWVVANVIPPLVEIFTFLAEEVVPVLANVFSRVSDEVLPVLGESFNVITEDVIPALGQVFEWIRTNILPPVQRIFEAWITNILPLLQKAFEFVQKWIKDNWPLISKIVGQVASAVKEAFNVIANIIEVVYPIVAKVAEVLFPVLGAAASVLLEVISRVFDLIGSIWTAASEVADTVVKAIFGSWEGMGKFFKKVWSEVNAVVKSGINFFIGLINGMIDLINGIKINIPGFETPFGKVASFNWDGLNLGKIPMLASGTGFFGGGLAVVGENGPELARLPRGTEVIGHSRAAGMMGSGGPLIGEQNIYGVTPDEVERQTRRALRRAALSWQLEGR